MTTAARPTPARSRRTQAERRAATRAALLDATIAGLVEHGYARLTTSQIVDSAGVTRGAQAHYFSTKAELVAEALTHLAHKIGDDLTAHPLPHRRTPPGRSSRHSSTGGGRSSPASCSWRPPSCGSPHAPTASSASHLEVYVRELNRSVVQQSALMAPLLAAAPTSTR